MIKLCELQNLFAKALLKQEETNKLAINEINNFRVYQDSLRASNIKALQETYPCTAKLVGTGFFNTAVYFYAQQYPMSESNFNLYGKDFAGFLQSYAPAQEITYLTELATLEWNYHLAHYAADPIAQNLAKTKELLIRNDGDIILQLQPSCQLLTFMHSILELWETCRLNSNIDRISLDKAPQYVLLYRLDYSIKVERISEAEYIFLKSISAGGSVLAAYYDAINCNSHFDFNNTLKNYLLKPILKIVL